MHLFPARIQTWQELPSLVQTFWNSQIPAATVYETRPGQLELEEDIQGKTQVPDLHREMVGALRKSSLITPLLHCLR